MNLFQKNMIQNDMIQNENPQAQELKMLSTACLIAGDKPQIIQYIFNGGIVRLATNIF